MAEETKKHPLILVYYAGEDVRSQPQVMKMILDQINSYIETKQWDIMFVALATSGEDRLECINPVVLSEEQMKETEEIIKDIKRGFDL